MSPNDSILASALETFRGQKRLAERAINQLDNPAMHQLPHPDGNSVVIVMKHMAGNMISRWTDFLTTDGEKPDRHRDREFEDDFSSRDELVQYWERGWKCVFDAMESISDQDLGRIVTIRGEPHSVARAIHQQIAHYGYHVGQIVTLARNLKGDDWQCLSVPRGGSEDYNRAMQERKE